MTSGTAVDFTVTYEDTTPDTDTSAPIGQYRGITQVDLTIGAGNSVTLLPTTDFDPLSSLITVANNVNPGPQDRLEIQVTASNFDTFSVDLRAPTTLFSSTSLDPIGGANPLNLSDFTVSQTATIIGNLTAAQANYSPNTITFPNSTPPVPAPSAMLLMGSGLVGLVGWRWWNTKKA